jgi:hypothetical protein
MRPAFAITTALLLLFGTAVAEAADPASLAQTAGFLLGNAHRCGVPTVRVNYAGNVIHRLIGAASFDPTEEAAANSRFAETFLASAFPDQDSDVLIPPCKVVIAQFERLERHHQQAGLN